MHRDPVDVVLTAPPSELFAYPPPRPNARRKKTVDLGPLADPIYERLLVRTALVRSETYDPRRLPVVSSPQDSAHVLRHLAAANQEHVICMCLDAQNRCVAIHETGIGSVDQSLFAPSDFLRVVLLSGARAAIWAHNHPSGDPHPSREDLQVWEQLKGACRCVGVELLDGLVIAQEGWYSFVGGAIGDW